MTLAAEVKAWKRANTFGTHIWFPERRANKRIRPAGMTLERALEIAHNAARKETA